MNRNKLEEVAASSWLKQNRFTACLFVYALINLFMVVNASAGLRTTLRAPANFAVTSVAASSVSLVWADQSNAVSALDTERNSFEQRSRSEGLG